MRLVAACEIAEATDKIVKTLLQLFGSKSFHHGLLLTSSNGYFFMYKFYCHSLHTVLLYYCLRLRKRSQGGLNLPAGHTSSIMSGTCMLNPMPPHIEADFLPLFPTSHDTQISKVQWSTQELKRFADRKIVPQCTMTPCVIHYYTQRSRHLTPRSRHI